jgi:hypothetical protein
MQHACPDPQLHGSLSRTRMDKIWNRGTQNEFLSCENMRIWLMQLVKQAIHTQDVLMWRCGPRKMECKKKHP